MDDSDAGAPAEGAKNVDIGMNHDEDDIGSEENF